MSDIFTGFVPPPLEDFSTTTVAVDSIQPSVVDDDGGNEVFLIGTFKNEPAQVLITREALTFECYSGSRGQGNRPVPLAGNVLRVVMPPMPIGADFTVEVIQGASSGSLPQGLVVAARSWRSKVFELRRAFPPRMRTGARSLNTVAALLGALPPVADFESPDTQQVDSFEACEGWTGFCEPDFDAPSTQFLDSFEATSGWTGIVVPTPDFDAPDTQQTESFETASGWT
jgi:hypothetical protein